MSGAIKEGADDGLEALDQFGVAFVAISESISDELRDVAVARRGVLLHGGGDTIGRILGEEALDVRLLREDRVVAVAGELDAEEIGDLALIVDLPSLTERGDEGDARVEAQPGIYAWLRVRRHKRQRRVAVGRGRVAAVARSLCGAGGS